jgi:hypothetical protein
LVLLGRGEEGASVVNVGQARGRKGGREGGREGGGRSGECAQRQGVDENESEQNKTKNHMSVVYVPAEEG